QPILPTQRCRSLSFHPLQPIENVGQRNAGRAQGRQTLRLLYLLQRKGVFRSYFLMADCSPKPANLLAALVMEDHLAASRRQNISKLLFQGHDGHVGLLQASDRISCYFPRQPCTSSRQFPCPYAAHHFVQGKPDLFWLRIPSLTFLDCLARLFI